MDIRNDKPHGSSAVVAIWPLRLMIEDQVRYSKSLTNSGIPAISIMNNKNPEIIQQVLNENYILVFGSPEWFVIVLHRPLWFVSFAACFSVLF